MQNKFESINEHGIRQTNVSTAKYRAPVKNGAYRHCEIADNNSHNLKSQYPSD